MLFSSFEFIFIFLPITWLVWRYLFRKRFTWAVSWIIIASLVFYGWWDPYYLILLICSIGINYWIAGNILEKNKMQTAWFWSGIFLNTILLFYFKYAHFFSEVLSDVTGNLSYTLPEQILPLGISFITFQKIAYLADCQRGLIKEHRFRNFAFFVTFFPQLIAGPIVHHNPLTEQLTQKNLLFFSKEAFNSGVMLFSLGLFKKVVLADSFAMYANPAYEMANLGPIDGSSAWVGMLAYTFQLYFDFSGYSDMAIGLGLMFGLKLPINFYSPYKSTSIIDFWRRWNISLSNFLRDYVYIPIGGNKIGIAKTYRNLLITMFIGGLWHGAGWTFILWGLWHGILLSMNHVLLKKQRFFSSHPFLSGFFSRFIGLPITFLLVALGWVLFRSASIEAAFNIYQGLLLPFSINIPTHDLIAAFINLSKDAVWLWLSVGAIVVWAAPNSMQWIRYDSTPNQLIKSHQGLINGFVTGLLLTISLKWMYAAPSTQFLYFNF